MNTNRLATVLLIIASPAAASQPGAGENGGNLYLIGAIIAFLILGYLIYSLLKPDKF